MGQSSFICYQQTPYNTSIMKFLEIVILSSCLAISSAMPKDQAGCPAMEDLLQLKEAILNGEVDLSEVKEYASQQGLTQDDFVRLLKDCFGVQVRGVGCDTLQTLMEKGLATETAEQLKEAILKGEVDLSVVEDMVKEYASQQGLTRKDVFGLLKDCLGVQVRGDGCAALQTLKEHAEDVPLSEIIQAVEEFISEQGWTAEDILDKVATYSALVPEAAKKVISELVKSSTNIVAEIESGEISLEDVKFAIKAVTASCNL